MITTFSGETPGEGVTVAEMKDGVFYRSTAYPKNVYYRVEGRTYYFTNKCTVGPRVTEAPRFERFERFIKIEKPFSVTFTQE